MSLLERIVSELPLSPASQQELTSPAVLRKHALYLRLPYLLAPAYPQVPAHQLEQLSVYGYLYFRFLVEFDQVLDQAGAALLTADSTKRIFDFCTVYEAAVRGLCSLFPESDSFWVHFDRCKKQYAGSNLQEKTRGRTRPEFTAAMFEDLAAGKSAACYAMVYALDSLSGQDRHSSQLLDCLRYLHIGLQCLDDVDDFVQDLTNQQYTFAHYLTRQVHLAQSGSSGPNLSPSELEFLFHTSRTAYGFYDRAQQHFRQTVQICQALGLPEFAAITQQLAHTAGRQQQQAALHADVHSQQRQKSNQPFFPDCPPFSPHLVPGALARCLQQLSASRNPQGRWSDLLTDQADSQFLVTAFAGALLCDGADQLALEASDSLFPIEQQPGRLLPGITMGLGLALQKRGSAHQPDPVPRAWLDYQNADGGWVAYRDVPALRLQLGGRAEKDVSGWSSAHACTTALNAWVLRRFSACAGAYAASCAWLLARQLPDGSWPAYWWSSPVFSTAYAVLALGQEPLQRPAAEQACRWLREQQQPDGSWHVHGKPSAFYTALAVQALLTSAGELNGAAVDAAAAWLIGQQRTDGSWPATPVLRLPEPDCHQLAPATHLKSSPFGLNVLLVDHNRVLTTAAAYGALRAYHHRDQLQQAA